MLCNFKKMNTEWICENCGRRVSINDNSKIYQPSAKCRMPKNVLEKLENIYKSNNPMKDFYYQKYIGVGSYILELLKTINIFYDPGCSCNSKIKIMDSKGIEWCEKNIDTIITWMENVAKDKNIKFSQKGAKSLIRLAIKKAKFSKNQSNQARP